MRERRGVLRRSATIWVVVSMLALASAGMAAEVTPPLQATIAFQNPPPNAIYAPGAPITLRLQVKNASGGVVRTTEGFTRTEFPRLLVFTGPNGALFGVTTAASAQRDAQPAYCFSRSRRLLSPTAIPVVPLERLESTYGQGQEYAFDARSIYNLSQSGRYSVEARIPLLVFDVSDTNAVITDCDQFDQGVELVNVGGDSTTALGRSAFTIISNTLEFSIVGSLIFGGFAAPLTDDTACASALPCQTFRLGRYLPVKFQLFDANHVVVTNATPRISVAKVSGIQPPHPPEDLGIGPSPGGDTFRFDPTENQYIFNLDTRRLSVGVWRIDALLDDSTVHSVHIGLH